jgi:ribose 1,5-bisphosphokinase
MIDAMRRAYANAVVVLITAPVQILAERLESRRRSSDGRLAERLVRKVDTLASAADLTITNVGSAEHHARELVRIVRGD